MPTTLNAASITPSITATDLDTSIRFYVDGLGFEVESRHEEANGHRWVMLKSGSISLGLGQDDFAKGKDRKKGIGCRIWIQTDRDLGALAAQLKQAGFSLNSEPAKTDWGMMAFTVTDPDGFPLTVSNPPANAS